MAEGTRPQVIPVDRAAAFRRLADQHLDSAYRFARAILRDPADAQDATHDAFVQAWRKWSTLRDPSRFVTVSSVTDGPWVTAQFDVTSGGKTSISLPLPETYVLPDGKHLATLDGQTVAVTDLAGNTVMQTPLPSCGTYYSALGRAPDGSAVLVAGFNPLAPAAQQQLPSNEIAATLSGSGELLIVPLDGGPVRTVTSGQDRNFDHGDMSPDLSTIVTDAFCISTCAQGPGIVSIDVSSGAFTSADGERARPARDVVARRRSDRVHPQQRRRARYLGHECRRLEPDPLDDAGAAGSGPRLRLSPDGSSILFSRGDTSKTGLGDLYMVPSIGGDPQLLLGDAVGDW